jgi:hypothetical protein
MEIPGRVRERVVGTSSHHQRSVEERDFLPCVALQRPAWEVSYLIEYELVLFHTTSFTTNVSFTSLFLKCSYLLTDES